MSDEDVFSVGSQIGGPQRATAAQMAQRRLARPRGGRRPGALRPPASPSPSIPHQQNTNSFGEGDRISMNGTQQQHQQQQGGQQVGQHGGFTFGQQPNGNQPNLNSASFPPFPSNSFNPSFAAPTSAFNFNTGQTQEMHNPFTAINTQNAPPPEQTGFQGSIFSLPAQKMSPFQKFLEGEQKPLFAPGAPDVSTSNQPQPSNNPFALSTNQQQPTQASPSIFSQANAQQQPSNNAFGASQPTSDMFAHLKTPQTQDSSNPFAQSIAQFQQSQSAQPAANLFAHLGQPQPSSSFLTQASTSPTQGGSTMMQISPDPSPQSRPFEFLNQPTLQPQLSPTKGSTAQGGGGSLFDRVTKPPAETSTGSEASPVKDTAVQGSGGSLFDRISKPPAETNVQTLFNPLKDSSATDSSSLSNMPQQPSTPDVSNETRATSPTKVSERKIAKPTLYQASSEESRPSYKAIFGNLKMPPTSQSSPSAIGGVAIGPQSSPSQSKQDSVSPTGELSSSVFAQHSSQKSKSIPATHQRFGPPSAPEGYTNEEIRKWNQDWWISFYVVHKEKRMKNAEHQCDERIKAIQGGFDPLEQIAGSKRKSFTRDRVDGQDAIQGKRARVEGGSTFTQVSQGASSFGKGRAQSPPRRDAPVQQVTNKNNKRFAEDELDRDSAQGAAENSKKARGHDPVSYPSLPAASSGSQTSSIFQNILDKKEEVKMNGTQNNKAAPVFQFPAPSVSSPNQSPSAFEPSSTSFAPLSSQPNSESPPKSSFSAFDSASSTSSSRFGASQQSTSNGALASTSAHPFKPTTSAAASSTAPNSSPFSFKPPTSNEGPSDTTKALAAKFSSGGTTSTGPSSTPFSAKPIASIQASSEDGKASAFKVPAFGAASAASPSSPFVLKPSMSGQTTSEAPKAPVFKVPNFGAGASTTNFMSQFSKAAAITEEEEKKKRKAEDYDSGEEDLASWERRDAEKQRLKKQKLEEEIKGKAAKLIDGKWFIAADSEKPGKSAEKPKPADPNVSVLSQPHAALTNGHNIFGHLSGEESGAEGSKTGDADDEDDDDERDEDKTNGQRQVRGPFDHDESESEPDEGKKGQTKVPKALSNPFGPMENGPSKSPSRNDRDGTEKVNGQNTGRSLFDRISKDKDGNPIRELPQAGTQATSQASNIFGQSFKPASPNNPFSQVPTPKAGDSPKSDHTWKVDSPIRFGDSNNPPALNVTSPSPSKPAFSGLFGAPKPSSTPEAPTKPASSVFSTPLAKTPSVGFSFGLKPATTSLAPPSNNGSNTTSRATSPGVTTGESANESNADGEDDKVEKQDQIDLTSLGPGEENEDVVLQVKAKALKWETDSSTWGSKGVGPLRVLKNRESHQTRVLLRQDPSGRIVLNFALSKSFTYESSQSKSVRVPFVSESSKIETWVIKVANDDDAKKLASALEENKS